MLADLRAGEPFTTAMERLAVRVPVPAVTRFVDGVVVAVERGTPLGDVLRAQAADVREQHKRDLIEAGGRTAVARRMRDAANLEADHCGASRQTIHEIEQGRTPTPCDGWLSPLSSPSSKWPRRRGSSG